MTTVLIPDLMDPPELTPVPDGFTYDEIDGVLVFHWEDAEVDTFTVTVNSEDTFSLIAGDYGSVMFDPTSMGALLLNVAVGQGWFRANRLFFDIEDGTVELEG